MPHIHEKIDFCVDAFIVHRNKVLIRKHDKYKQWTSPGGHIELDETPDIAILREIKEEVGLDITLISSRPIPKDDGLFHQLIPPWYVRVHPIPGSSHQHVDLIYFAISDNDVVVPEKVDDEWRWLSIEDLRKNELGMSESVLFYATQALEELSKK